MNLTPTISDDSYVEQPIVAKEPHSVSLSGPWRFLSDINSAGVDERWFDPDFPDSDWIEVEVPHTWNVMPDYADYEGVAWYRQTFMLAEDLTDYHVQLHFDSVYYKAQVWLNGIYLGEHAGGYTPFEFDVSSLIDNENVLAVRVDNIRLPTRIPDDTFDWWHYGGIVRQVSLKLSSRVFIERQIVTAVPQITGWDEADLATVSTSVQILNTSSDDFEGIVIADILEDQSGESALNETVSQRVSIPPGGRVDVELRAEIQDPRLWHFDHPNLYRWSSVLQLSEDERLHVKEDIFGVRLVELEDAQFILNGEPVRLVGMTRHADSPEYGLAEPAVFMTADFDDMKRLNMVFSRPVHYPQDESVLDYCDRNGILLIPEIPAWQIQESHLSNVSTITAAKQQLREMILTSINHPSIWAWSVGNEIDSNTPAGRDYVRELAALSHELDPARPVGFASFRLDQNQENDASALTDFVFMNEYFGSWHGPKEALPESLDRIHELWPEKVVIISEFGLEAGWTSARWMGDTSLLNNESYYYIEPGTPPDSEQVFSIRSQLIADQMDIFRSRPFVVGAIFWTYQDYRSEMAFKMGLLDQNRNRTSVMDVLREQYSPLRGIEIDIGEVSDGRQTADVRLETRGPVGTDIPVYTLREYAIRYSIISTDGNLVYFVSEKPLPVLAPASVWNGEISWDVPLEDFIVEISIVRPTGFSVWESRFNADGEQLD